MLEGVGGEVCGINHLERLPPQQVNLSSLGGEITVLHVLPCVSGWEVFISAADGALINAEPPLEDSSCSGVKPSAWESVPVQSG